MKAFKKLVAAVLVCVMALTILTACGGGSSTSSFSAKLTSALKNKGITVTYDSALTTKAQKMSASIAGIDPEKVKNMTDQEGEALMKKIFVDSGLSLLSETVAISEGKTEDAQISSIVDQLVELSTVEPGTPMKVNIEKFGYAQVTYGGQTQYIVVASYTTQLIG